MRYTSTRDNNIHVDSLEVISKGISNEGGLFVPESIPFFSLDQISSMVNLDYIEKAKLILSPFLTEFSIDEIEESLKKAYTIEKFGSINPAPLHNNFKNFDKLSSLELFHGPTLAFKDIALQLLPNLLTKAIGKKYSDKEVMIMVATSGDTGKAALEGFKDVPKTKLIVFYPKDGVSHIQKLQMKTQEGKNLKVCAIEGNFDDAQTNVKNIFKSAAAKSKLDDNNMIFSSANSINWGRLLPQIVYYFSSYCELIKDNKIKIGEKINFVVPTGNFGNILAGYYAKEMGLPIGKLICASNKNNILTDFIKSGVYNKKRKFYLTISPSMDILVSSNLERLLYHLSNKNDSLISKYMDDLKYFNEYSVSHEIKRKIDNLFFAGYCNDQETSDTIKMFFEKEHYLFDPHSAVALNVYLKYLKETNDKSHTVLVSTASPYKFPNDTLNALGYKLKGQSNDFDAIEYLEKQTGIKAPKKICMLKNNPIKFNEECAAPNMEKCVLDFIEK